MVCYDLAGAFPDDATRAAETLLEELGDYARVVRMGDAAPIPDLRGRGSAAGRACDAWSIAFARSCPRRCSRAAAHSARSPCSIPQPRVFSAEEVDLARVFAEQAALAIENARLHAEVEQRMRENERRRQVAEGMRDLLASVNSTRSLDEVLDLVLAQASDLLGSDAGSVLLLDDTDGERGTPDRPRLAVAGDRSHARPLAGRDGDHRRGRRARASGGRLGHAGGGARSPGEPEPLIEERPAT